MKNFIKYSVFALIVFLITSCEEDASTMIVENDYVTFESGPIDFRVNENSTDSKDISVYVGQVVGADRSYTITVSEESTILTPYTVPSTVTIPANSNVGVLTISVTDNASLQFVAQTLVLEIQDEQGINTGDDLVVNVSESCLSNIVSLSINFDNYAEETSWAIYSASDLSNPIFNGGQNSAYDDLDGGSFSQDFCLDNGDYYFAIFDSYSDGMCCSYGQGSYSLVSNGTTLASGGQFGANEVTPFTL